MSSDDRELPTSPTNNPEETDHEHHRTVVIFVSPEPNHKPSQHAFHWAQNNLIRAGDIVILVACVPNPKAALAPAMGGYGSAAVSAEIEALDCCRKSIMHTAKQVMKEYKSRAKPDGWELHTRLLDQTSGSVADTLVQWVNKHAVEDVVVGQRNVGALKGAMLALTGRGSVSKSIVNHVHCPVVVVKEDSS